MKTQKKAVVRGTRNGRLSARKCGGVPKKSLLGFDPVNPRSPSEFYEFLKQLAETSKCDIKDQKDPKILVTVTEKELAHDSKGKPITVFKFDQKDKNCIPLHKEPIDNAVVKAGKSPN